MLLTQRPSLTPSLDNQEQQQLLQVYEKGEEINLLDRGLWQVHRGVVQLSRLNEQGKESILGWATPSLSFFGNWLQDSSANRAVALIDVYVTWYPAKEIESSPTLMRYLLAQFSDRLIKSSRLLTITGHKKVEERLRELLLMLKQEMGQNMQPGKRIQIRFTHQNLADVICTTRVTVTRLLGEFQAKNWIAIDDERHIIVKEALSLKL